MIRRILQIDDTPHSIALGASLGMLIAMTPTIGIQIVAAAIVCTALRANRLAGIIMVFVSNPLTMVPIYWADYWLGAKLVGADLISQSEFEAIWGRITEAGMIGGIRVALAVLTGEIFLPMMLGGTVIGAILALPVYPLTFRAVVARRRRLERRRALRKLREQRAAEVARDAAPPAPAPVSSAPERSDPERSVAEGETRPAARRDERREEPEREESLR
jgi:uncharacterized protein (DUF2062 family)